MAIPFWVDLTGLSQKADGTYEGFDGPDYSERPWDIVTFVVDQRLLRSPGVATVKCIPRERLDIQKPNGGDVGALIARGHEPARVEITIKIWTPTQWDILQELTAALWRKSGGASRQDRSTAKKPSATETTKSAAISISHPSTDMFGVGAIVIETIESIDIATDLTGILRIKAVQYAPPTKKNVTRKKEGAGKVAQVPEHQLNRNQAGPAVSKTDGLPSLKPTPARGGS